MSEKSTISTGPERDDPPRFTREMAERGRHMIGDQVIREARPRGRPPLAAGERKEKVTLRVSPEVLAYFRAQGEGWQTRLDQLLQHYVRYAEPREENASVRESRTPFRSKGSLIPTLKDRIQRIADVEDELPRKAAAIMENLKDITHADLFVLGAFRRTLAQASGFRSLLQERNFPCAAAILRLQLDTAMRIHGLTLLDDRDASCKAVLAGKLFNKLQDRNGKRLSDAHLRASLAEEYPWIDPIYTDTSNFVHLSGRHFDVAIARTEEATRMAYFQISAVDPPRPESVYFEVVDAFFEVTKLAGTLLLGYLMARGGKLGGRIQAM
jgi:uncharacterized protein (DUF4415 family)